MATTQATAGTYTTSVSRSASEQAYQLLHFGFTVLPIIAGADKFFNVLTQWDRYLAPAAARLLAPTTFMRIVGVIEMAAGILVAVKPSIGAYVVCAWLLAIVVNLLMLGSFYDVALRDFGLAIGALALARLSADRAR